MKEVKPLMPKLKRREIADVLPGFVSRFKTLWIEEGF